MADVYIGLGSNIEPEVNLREAVRRLGEALGTLTCSRVYRSPPYGFAGPEFLNLVVHCERADGPAAVDAVLTRIEDAAGRSPERQGSRTLDLDLLLYGARVDARERLPRADVLEYPFVLAPLVELAPDTRHPVTGRTYADHWKEMAERAEPLTLVGPITELT